MKDVIEILNKGSDLSRDEIIKLLNLTDDQDIEYLFNAADRVRMENCGNEVHLRGVIEFSNNCKENCLYCGLREDNITLQRYRMTPDEIIETARQISNLGIRTIVLQSGEDGFYDTDLIAYLIYSIKQNSDIAIALSIGERGFDEYKAWKIAGVGVRLPQLFAQGHPANRGRCLMPSCFSFRVHSFSKLTCCFKVS